MINTKQLIQTLDKLITIHQNIIDEFNKNDEDEIHSPDEVVQFMVSSDALDMYNDFKNRYEFAIKYKKELNYV